MADRIVVSTAEMSATISRYEQAQNTMLDAQKSMDNAMKNLNACWKGAAWAAMMAKWAEIEGNIAKSQLAINRTIVGLKTTIGAYDEAEDANKNTSSGLDVGTTSTVYVE